MAKYIDDPLLVDDLQSISASRELDKFATYNIDRFRTAKITKTQTQPIEIKALLKFLDIIMI